MIKNEWGSKDLTVEKVGIEAEKDPNIDRFKTTNEMMDIERIYIYIKWINSLII